MHDRKKSSVHERVPEPTPAYEVFPQVVAQVAAT